MACRLPVSSQVVIGGRNVASFGIDGDLSLDTALLGSFAGFAGDDWFVNPSVRKKAVFLPSTAQPLQPYAVRCKARWHFEKQQFYPVNGNGQKWCLSR